MLRNRIILVAAIIAAGVFASFYGGNVPYALFYLTLFIPVIALLYTLYVFLRVRVYQQIDNMEIVKGQPSGYTFQIANEDFISYQDLKLHFYTGTSTISAAQRRINYCLQPGEQAGMDSTIRCHFRGRYPVGVYAVQVTDIFNLFQLTYPIRSRNVVTVLPRKVKLSTLNILPVDEDSKNVLFRTRAKEENLDIDMRKYVPGDSRRLIHWKTTARRGELMSRQYTENMKLSVMLCMDLSPTGIGDVLERAEVEDKIIESCIAISDYCRRHSTPCDIYYEEDAVEKVTARTLSGFEEFYTTCGRLAFTAKADGGKLLDNILARETGLYRYIVVTHTLTGALYSAAMQTLSGGSTVTVVVMRDILDPEQENIREYMSKASIPVVQIQRDEDFTEVFARTLE